MLIQCSLCHLSSLYLRVFISLKEHAYAQLLKWKLSDCGLWHWQLKPKWLTTCIRTPLDRTPALRLLDRSREILLLIDVLCLSRSISEFITYLPSWLTHVHKFSSNLEGCSSGLIQDVTSFLTLGRDPQGVPFLCSHSSKFFTVFLSLIYYLLTITRRYTCNSLL